MAGKVKFDQEAAFKSIIGSAGGPQAGNLETPVVKEKNKDWVHRSYFLDRGIDKALKRMTLEEGKKLTEIVNELLRYGLSQYLKFEEHPCRLLEKVGLGNRRLPKCKLQAVYI